MTAQRRWRFSGIGLECLRLNEEMAPEPGPGEILLRVRATALNARDLMVARGQLMPRAELVPLSDGAGEVIAVGDGVESVKVADRVVAAFRQGWISGPLDPSLRGAADLGCAIDGMLGTWALLGQDGVAHIPPGMSFEEAACFPCAGVTAWRALMAGRTVRPGETVLVLGTGGVSLFAVQIARAAGARVIATTSSQEKVERLNAMGVSIVIDSQNTPDWDLKVLESTGGLGVDHVVEVGGAGSLERSMRCTRLEGRISLVGLLGGTGAAIDPLGFVSRVLTLQGVSVGSRKDLSDVMAAFSANAATPVIDRRFTFEEAPAAYRHLEGRSHFGKVVIVHG